MHSPRLCPQRARPPDGLVPPFAVSGVCGNETGRSTGPDPAVGLHPDHCVDGSRSFWGTELAPKAWVLCAPLGSPTGLCVRGSVSTPAALCFRQAGAFTSEQSRAICSVCVDSSSAKCPRQVLAQRRSPSPDTLAACSPAQGMAKDTKTPRLFPLVSGCEAPNEGDLIGLACLAQGPSIESVQVSSSPEAQDQRQKTHLIMLGMQGHTQLSVLMANWKPGLHHCSAIIREATNSPKLHKAIQWPASWEVRTSGSTRRPSLPEDSTKAPSTARVPELQQVTEASGAVTVDPGVPAADCGNHTHPPSISCALSQPSTPSQVASTAPGEHAATAPCCLAVRALTVPQAAFWLLCEVSGFSPPDILLTWLKGQTEVDPAGFATARPTAQPGNSTFRTWSVLRVLAAQGPGPATYTCVVRHDASRKLLNTSWSLDTGLAMTLPPPQSQDESGRDSTDLEDANRLWPTFAALFLLTLLYSGFVTFIKRACRELEEYTAVMGRGRSLGPLSPEALEAPSLHLHIPTAEQMLAACSHLTWLGGTQGPGPCSLGTLPLTPNPFLTPGLLLQVK
ncbi:PREDICTED: uncharacterized protein LOC101383460 [Odobenus rosmarus divergens]|uniref:Uncharacterized protein LOC101383460 n=1 Tax=Odobenus rosmarus divergens TaxID=9708 RepID=A0A2U3X2E2_ODORO|nr:PREDICTED: uncharacterized protein LOC101383460 [Odobenus rosmarus divergens]